MTRALFHVSLDSWPLTRVYFSVPRLIKLPSVKYPVYRDTCPFTRISINIVIATCRFLLNGMPRIMYDVSNDTMPRVKYDVSYDTWNRTRGPWYLTRGFVEIRHVACHVSMCYVYSDKCPFTRILKGMVIATCHFIFHGGYLVQYHVSRVMCRMIRGK